MMKAVVPVCAALSVSVLFAAPKGPAPVGKIVKGDVVEPAPEGVFTYAVIPDTQRYAGAGARKGDKTGPTRNETFARRIDWVLANRAAQRIGFLSHMGDAVDVNNIEHWTFASNQMARLDGVLPYGMVVGNHDMFHSGDSTLFSAHFPASRFAGCPWYGGTFAGTDENLAKKGQPEKIVHVSGNNANSFQLIDAGAAKFIFVHLEANAPDAALAWADGVLDAHKDRVAVIATHAYLGPVTYDKLRYPHCARDVIGRMAWKKCHGKRGNTPEEMWRKCFSRHGNLCLVVCGDQSCAITWRQTSKNAAGGTVNEVLQDFGAGSESDWVRLFRFHPDKRRIDVVTVSAADGRKCLALPDVPDAAEHCFTLTY